MKLNLKKENARTMRLIIYFRIVSLLWVGLQIQDNCYCLVNPQHVLFLVLLACVALPAKFLECTDPALVCRLTSQNQYSSLVS